jgi:hypothetical protein
VPGQLESKGRALGVTRLELDAPAMRQHDLLRDVKAKPQAALAPAVGVTVARAKGIE